MPEATKFGLLHAVFLWTPLAGCSTPRVRFVKKSEGVYRHILALNLDAHVIDRAYLLTRLFIYKCFKLVNFAAELFQQNS